MADIILQQNEQLRPGTRIRYRDMGDGTHALVSSVVAEGGGATQYPEDSPSVSGDLGTMALAIRNDAGGSLVSANGDYAPLQVNAAGQLIIAGGAGGTSMADDSAFAPGTTQITPMGAMLDDVAPDSIDEGDAGVPRMSANRNLYVRIRDDAGNERGLNVDVGGRLGANIHDGAGTALTSTPVGADQALDVNIVAGAGAGGTSMVDDAAFTPAVSAITPIGAMLDDTAPDSVDEGDAGVVRMSANRNLYTAIRDAAGNERGLNVDAAGAIAVTNGALAVVGGGVEATAQRVTIANDSTGLLSVDDGGGSLTVDNPALSVVGGGVEAAAQRVTIANDSTGVLSVDDNAGSLTVDQATHGNLQCNANIQVGDVDVANGNPVPISDAGGSITVDGTVAIQEPLSVDDNGGSLTVDNAALSVVGGGAEATAQRVTIANDSTGVLSVDDAGGSLTVDGGVTADIRDGGGAALTSTLVGADQALDVNIVQTVGGAGGTSMADDAAFTPATTQVTPVAGFCDDTAPDSVDEGDAGAVRMSANRNLYVRIRDDAGNERGLNVDAGGDIGVTNAALAIIGGGVEAAALRVTIANDSTGLLSIDDNGGSLTVDQAYHDNLLCNANIQVGDADVAVGNPVPVSDAGGSLTVDGGVTADMRDGAGTALTSTLVGADQALDVNIVAGAGAGGTSMVDDTAFTPASTAITPAGAMFDDTAPDSVDEGDAGVVRMSANRNLYVTMRDAAGNERGLNIDAAGALGVNDGGGSLTVDNAALSVVGGGVEAAAQRVTIANDSTGVLSVDDNAGSLTVDQAAHDNLQCNANVQVGDADVAVGNPVPVAGTAVEDAACAGNPVLIGGRYHATVVAADAVDDGDAVRLLVDSVGGVIKGHRADAWNANDNYAVAQTDTVVKAAPGAGLALYVTDILFSTDAAMNIFLEAGAGTITPKVYLAVNGGWSAHFQTPIRWTTNTAITLTSSAAGNHSVLILGYTAP